MHRHNRISIERAGDGAKVIRAFEDAIYSGDPEDVLPQMLNRLLHFANVTGRDFDDALSIADNWYTTEKGE